MEEALVYVIRLAEGVPGYVWLIMAGVVAAMYLVNKL
jgi:hypothetical protein